MTGPLKARRRATVDEGYRRAAAITRAHGTTYFWGACLLPRSSRRHVHALYALARTADDIVDRAAAGTNPGGALTAFENAFWCALQGGEPSTPLLSAVAASVHQLGIDEECFARFFHAMRLDLTCRAYTGWDDLLQYMEGSAAVIGEMMLPVLQGPPSARSAARSLGLAFQLTNFLRDVNEDLDRGRVYLPQADLERFGADPHRRTNDASWRALMRFQIDRNRELYLRADAGLAVLPLEARRCVVTARVLYARILTVIEDANYDVFHQRAVVPTAHKAAVAARVAMSRDPARVLVAQRGRARPVQL